MKSDTRSGQKMITVVIADDQLVIRETLQSQLAIADDIKVIAHADNGFTALSKVSEMAPDIIIIDLEMPDMDGITAITKISDLFPETKSLVFSSHDERQYINQAIIAGAKGYLLKGTPAQDIVHAIRNIDRGYFQLGSGLLEKMSLQSSKISLGSSKVSLQSSLESQQLYNLESRLVERLHNLIEHKLDDKNETSVHEDWLEQKVTFILANQTKINSQLRKIELFIYLLLFWQIVLLIICFSIT